MNRRRFNKLLTGTAVAASASRARGAKDDPGQPEPSNIASGTSAGLSATSVVPPSGGSNPWEFVMLDAAPPHMTETDGTAAADIDGDGRTELIITGNGALLWYRPSTSEKGVIATGQFSVGVALEDVDQDGHMEIVTGKLGQDQKWGLGWYKFGTSLHYPWTAQVFDPETN